LHHATIVDEHEQRVKAEAAKHANSPRKQGGKGHWAQLRVSAPAPSLRDFAFAVRLARRWMPSSHFPSIPHVIDRSANKGSPNGPRVSIGLFQAATTNEDDGYLKELTQLKPPADAVP
jgi:hypothetical protein